MAEGQAIGIADLALLDDDFILALTESRERDIYAKVIALDINELPIDQIEGRVTGGSISVDGDSTVRRTCNLTMVADDIEINDYYWGIKTKISLEIGLKNNLTNEKYQPGQNSIYPEVVWFKQGIFVITSFNSSLGTNNYTISLSGKDKMCFLNGDLGGQLFASIDFGTEETKEIVMLPVDILESSSEAILEGSAYYKRVVQANSSIDATNSNYIFVKIKKTIPEDVVCFKKIRNEYVPLEANESYEQQKYIGYQLITDPNDLFMEIGNFEKDKTYKRTDGDYYLMAKSEEDIGNDDVFYSLVQLYEPSYEYNIIKIPLAQIIREAVHAYAQEPYHNILINDLDDYGLEQLTFRGDAPLYGLRDVSNDNISYQLISSAQIPEDLMDLLNQASFVYDNHVDDATATGTTVYYDSITGTWNSTTGSKAYTVAKYEYGDDIGYRITDLTYTGDLVSSIGDTLTAVLDKIKDMLGNFEYFYDIRGKFIFQRKRTFVDVAWSKLTNYSNDEDAYINAIDKKFSFNFEDNRLITALQNAPVLTNLRNDYVVWGKRTTVSGTDVPIHARYAIDVKPQIYNTLDGRTFISNESPVNDNENAYYVDWRELIYQMALDYFMSQGCSEKNPIYDLSGNVVLTSPDDFAATLGRLNPEYYASGETGYEQYYTDLQGFWRELYDPFYEPSLIYDVGKYVNQIEKLSNSKYFKKRRVWQGPGIVDCNFNYYVKNHNIDTTDIEDEDIKAVIDAKILRYTITSANEDIIGDRLYWNTQVFESPESLNFWFDFLDGGQELQQFSIAAVGDRTKVVNENRAQAIVFAEIPDVILYNKEDYEDLESDNEIIEEIRKQRNLESAYTFINIPSGYSQFFTISYRSMSIKDKIDELLYNYSYCIDNITLTTLPVYHLQPNTLIFVCDKNTGIEGEYIVKKLNIPLTYNGTMSITAVKAPQRLY